MRTLIKNGHIVTAVDSYIADLLVDGSTVAVIGKDLSGIVGSPDRTIDATGKLVIPGGIDPHTHMDLPFGGTSASDDFETGTRAAAVGGTTTIVDFAVQYHGQSLNQALDAWFAKAEGKACIDYGFHMIVTDLPDQRLPELKALINQGVSSFKLFMAYPGVFLVDDGTIFKAMTTAGGVLSIMTLPNCAGVALLPAKSRNDARSVVPGVSVVNVTVAMQANPLGCVYESVDPAPGIPAMIGFVTVPVMSGPERLSVQLNIAVTLWFVHTPGV